MRFCFPSQLVGATATITSSTAVDADYPLTNLHDGLPTEPTRWTTGASTRIVWDLGAGSPVPTVEGLLVVMHTLPAGATLTVQANGADAWGAPSFSQVVTVPAWGPEPLLALPPNLLVDCGRRRWRRSAIGSCRCCCPTPAPPGPTMPSGRCAGWGSGRRRRRARPGRCGGPTCGA